MQLSFPVLIQPFSNEASWQLHFLFFIRKPETTSFILFCFDLRAEERRHGLHATPVHLCQTFLSSCHLLRRLE